MSEMDERMDHPINRSINDTVIQIVKALQVSLKNSELSGEDKIKVATIAMSEAIKHYVTFLNQVGAEVSYTMILHHFQAIQEELKLGPDTTPYQMEKQDVEPVN